MFKKRTVKTLACIGVAAAALVFWQQKQLQTRLETENQALRQELEDLKAIARETGMSIREVRESLTLLTQR